MSTHQCRWLWERGWKRCRGKHPRRPRRGRASPGRASSPWCAASEPRAWRAATPTCPSLPGPAVTGWGAGGEPGYRALISTPAEYGDREARRDDENILTRRFPSTDMMIMEIITMICTIIIDCNLKHCKYLHQWFPWNPFSNLSVILRFRSYLTFNLHTYLLRRH